MGVISMTNHWIDSIPRVGKVYYLGKGSFNFIKTEKELINLGFITKSDAQEIIARSVRMPYLGGEVYQEVRRYFTNFFDVVKTPLGIDFVRKSDLDFFLDYIIFDILDYYMEDAYCDYDSFSDFLPSIKIDESDGVEEYMLSDSAYISGKKMNEYLKNRINRLVLNGYIDSQKAKSVYTSWSKKLRDVPFHFKGYLDDEDIYHDTDRYYLKEEVQSFVSALESYYLGKQKSRNTKS